MSTKADPQQERIDALKETANAEVDKLLGGTTEAPVEKVETPAEAPPEPQPAEGAVDTPAVEERLPEVKMEDTPEFQLAVEKAANKRWQSTKDQSLTPILSEKKALETENARLKTALGIVETAEIDTWTEEKNVGDFQARRRELLSRETELDKQIQELTTEREANNAQTRENNASALAFKVLSDSGAPFSSYEGLVKEFNEADTDRERELLATMRTKELKVSDAPTIETPQEPAKVVPRPDSSRTAPVGGGKFTRQGLRDYDARGKTPAEMKADAEELVAQVTGNRR